MAWDQAGAGPVGGTTPKMCSEIPDNIPGILFIRPTIMGLENRKQYLVQDIPSSC